MMMTTSLLVLLVMAVSGLLLLQLLQLMMMMMTCLLPLPPMMMKWLLPRAGGGLGFRLRLVPMHGVGRGPLLQLLLPMLMMPMWLVAHGGCMCPLLLLPQLQLLLPVVHGEGEGRMLLLLQLQHMLPVTMRLAVRGGVEGQMLPPTLREVVWTQLKGAGPSVQGHQELQVHPPSTAEAQGRLLPLIRSPCCPTVGQERLVAHTAHPLVMLEGERGWVRRGWGAHTHGGCWLMGPWPQHPGARHLRTLVRVRMQWQDRPLRSRRGVQLRPAMTKECYSLLAGLLQPATATLAVQQAKRGHQRR